MTQVFKWFVNDIRIVSDEPRVVRADFNNYDVAVFSDESGFWRVKILGKDFIVKIPGTPGFRIAFVQALRLSEEMQAVTDALMDAGYRKVDPLHYEWVIFESPDYNWVSISPTGANSDPRGEWGVYSHSDSVRRSLERFA
jgi:hypothetical protein